MTTPTIHVNPVEFDWIDATANVNPADPFSAAEVTGFVLGIRALGASGSAAGTYPLAVPIPDASALKELMSGITPVLAPAGDAANAGYAAAIMSTGPQNSAWSAVEYLFSIVPPPPPIPLPPTFSDA